MGGKMSEALARIEAFRRQVLRELLGKCTVPQIEVFGRVFPEGVPADKLNIAITLCERTVAKNEAGRGK